MISSLARRPGAVESAGVVRTRRGRAVALRSIRQSDAALLVDLLERLSPEARRLRFMMPVNDMPAEVVWREARRLAAVDPDRGLALVATAREDGRERIVGVARLYYADDPGDAEFALVVRDDYQGEGLGRALLERLVALGRARGLRRLQGLTLAENTAVRRLIQTIGLPVDSQTSRGETALTIAIE